MGARQMDEKTLIALKASIQHWRENVEAAVLDNVSILADDCALCDAFYFSDVNAFDEEIQYCVDCPVKMRTGIDTCQGSPYREAWESHYSWRKSPTSITSKATWRKAAQAELDFLISLLPEGEEA